MLQHHLLSILSKCHTWLTFVIWFIWAQWFSLSGKRKTYWPHFLWEFQAFRQLDECKVGSQRKFLLNIIIEIKVVTSNYFHLLTAEEIMYDYFLRSNWNVSVFWVQLCDAYFLLEKRSTCGANENFHLSRKLSPFWFLKNQFEKIDISIVLILQLRQSSLKTLGLV